MASLTTLTVTLEDFLILTWPIDPAVLADAIPDEMRPDVWETGVGLVSAVAFRNHALRPAGLPLAGVDFWQLNLRAYVRRWGVPGVWFFRMYLDRYAAVLLEGLATAITKHADFATRRVAGSVRLLVADRSGALLWAVADETAGGLPAGRRVEAPGRALLSGEDGLEDLADFVLNREVGWFPARWGGIGEIRVEHESMPVRPLALREIDAPVWRALGVQLTGQRGTGRRSEPVEPVALAVKPVPLSIHLPSRARSQVRRRPLVLPRPAPVPAPGVAADLGGQAQLPQADTASRLQKMFQAVRRGAAAAHSVPVVPQGNG